MHAQILESMLKMTGDLQEQITALRAYPWDSEPLIVLTPKHVRNALQRYMQGNVSEETIETWANAIEGRDDIVFAVEAEDALKEAIHELANPLLTEMLSHQSAKRLFETLS